MLSFFNSYRKPKDNTANTDKPTQATPSLNNGESNLHLTALASEFRSSNDSSSSGSGKFSCNSGSQIFSQKLTHELAPQKKSDDIFYILDGAHVQYLISPSLTETTKNDYEKTYKISKSINSKLIPLFLKTELGQGIITVAEKVETEFKFSKKQDSNKKFLWKDFNDKDSLEEAIHNKNIDVSDDDNAGDFLLATLKQLLILKARCVKYPQENHCQSLKLYLELRLKKCEILIKSCTYVKEKNQFQEINKNLTKFLTELKRNSKIIVTQQQEDMDFVAYYSRDQEKTIKFIESMQIKIIDQVSVMHTFLKNTPKPISDEDWESYQKNIEKIVGDNIFLQWVSKKIKIKNHDQIDYLFVIFSYLDFNSSRKISTNGHTAKPSIVKNSFLQFEKELKIFSVKCRAMPANANFYYTLHEAIAKFIRDNYSEKDLPLSKFFIEFNEHLKTCYATHTRPTKTYFFDGKAALIEITNLRKGLKDNSQLKHPVTKHILFSLGQLEKTCTKKPEENYFYQLQNLLLSFLSYYPQPQSELAKFLTEFINRFREGFKDEAKITDDYIVNSTILDLSGLSNNDSFDLSLDNGMNTLQFTDNDDETTDGKNLNISTDQIYALKEFRHDLTCNDFIEDISPIESNNTSSKNLGHIDTLNTSIDFEQINSSLQSSVTSNLLTAPKPIDGSDKKSTPVLPSDTLEKNSSLIFQNNIERFHQSLLKLKPSSIETLRILKEKNSQAERDSPSQQKEEELNNTLEEEEKLKKLLLDKVNNFLSTKNSVTFGNFKALFEISQETVQHIKDTNLYQFLSNFKYIYKTFASEFHEKKSEISIMVYNAGLLHQELKKIRTTSKEEQICKNKIYNLVLEIINSPEEAHLEKYSDLFKTQENLTKFPLAKYLQGFKLLIDNETLNIQLTKLTVIYNNNFVLSNNFLRLFIVPEEIKASALAIKLKEFRAEIFQQKLNNFDVIIINPKILCDAASDLDNELKKLSLLNTNEIVFKNTLLKNIANFILLANDRSKTYNEFKINNVAIAVESLTLNEILTPFEDISSLEQEEFEQTQNQELNSSFKHQNSTIPDDRKQEELTEEEGRMIEKAVNAEFQLSIDGSIFASIERDAHEQLASQPSLRASIKTNPDLRLKFFYNTFHTSLRRNPDLNLIKTRNDKIKLLEQLNCNNEILAAAEEGKKLVIRQKIQQIELKIDRCNTKMNELKKLISTNLEAWKKQLSKLQSSLSGMVFLEDPKKFNKNDSLKKNHQKIIVNISQLKSTIEFYEKILTQSKNDPQEINESILGQTASTYHF